jgi:hypothetical protein
MGSSATSDSFETSDSPTLPRATATPDGSARSPASFAARGECRSYRSMKNEYVDPTVYVPAFEDSISDEDLGPNLLRQALIEAKIGSQAWVDNLVRSPADGWTRCTRGMCRYPSDRMMATHSSQDWRRPSTELG